MFHFGWLPQKALRNVVVSSYSALVHAVLVQALPVHDVPVQAVPVHAVPVQAVLDHEVPVHALPVHALSSALCHTPSSTDGMGIQAREMPEGFMISTRVVIS